MATPLATNLARTLAAGNTALTPSQSQIAGVGVNPHGMDPHQHKQAARGDVANVAKLALPTTIAVTRKDAYTNPRTPKQPDVISKPEAQIHVAPPREIAESGASQAIGQVGTVGNAAMQAEFMLPMGGWLLRNTIGQVSQRLRQSIGAVTYAPFKALWNSSVKDVLTGNWAKMRNNYYRAFYEYTAGVPYGKAGQYTPWDSLERKIKGSKQIETLEKTKGSIWNRLWNGRAFGVLLKGGLGAASLYLGIKAVASTRHSISMMQELGQDLYGEQYSTWQIMMNPQSMPPFMQEVRGNMMAHLMPEAAHAVGESGSNWALSDGMHGLGNISSKVGMAKQAAMFGGIMISMQAQNLAPSENLLSSYTMLKDTLKAGNPAPAELYAALVEAASADARTAGGANSRLVRSIAEEYAKEQKSAVDVLKEIDGKEAYLGRAKRAAANIKKEDEAQKAASKPAHNGPIVPAKKQTEKQTDYQAVQTPPAVSQPASGTPSEKPAPVVAGQGLTSHGKVQTQQLAAEV